jgi:hypothetical protein
MVSEGKGGAFPPTLHGFVIRICAAPDAGRFVEHVAFLRIGAAARSDSRRVGQVIGRVDHFRFEGDLVSYVVTKTDLGDFPFFFRHGTPPEYLISLPIL